MAEYGQAPLQLWMGHFGKKKKMDLSLNEACSARFSAESLLLLPTCKLHSITQSAMEAQVMV